MNNKFTFKFRQDFNDHFPLVYTKQFVQIKEAKLKQFSTWKVQKVHFKDAEIKIMLYIIYCIHK